MTEAVWLMLPFCISWLSFLSVAFQAWVGLHLYGRWGLEFLAVWVLESYFGYVVMVFFRSECMNTLELALKFGRRLMAFFQDFSVGYPNIICQCLIGIRWKFSTCWLKTWLLMMWVLPPPPLFVWHLWWLVVVWSFSYFRVNCDFSDVFESLGWVWGVCGVWVGFGVE